jgi:hypothetical protein
MIRRLLRSRLIRSRWFWAFAILILPILLLVPAGSIYYAAAGGEACIKCHELKPAYHAWTSSTHREVACKSCHGSIFSTDLDFHLNNVRQLILHVRGQVPERLQVKHADIVRGLNDRCGQCHAAEHAAWKSGPHGASFSRIFLDPKHNARRHLTDHCLQCHGMYYPNGIDRLVQPLDQEGPWSLADAAVHPSHPSIPCLACHQVHREGVPHALQTNSPVQKRVSLAFYDRREQVSFAAENLPMPVIREGERLVNVPRDPVSALCSQCHAADATQQVGSGDDRTCTGVHEGLSCAACHQKHTQDARSSCAQCHPRLSNCGLDVAQMDTTFKSPGSRHNIHRVSCADCHGQTVPPRRQPGSIKPPDRTALVPPAHQPHPPLEP